MPPKSRAGLTRPKGGKGKKAGNNNPNRTEDQSEEEVVDPTSNMAPTTEATRTGTGQKEEDEDLGGKSPEPETKHQVTSSVDVTEELKKNCTHCELG